MTADPDELEGAVEIDPATGLIVGDDSCGHQDGTPHGGTVRGVERMCLHEHWSGSQYCDAHLLFAVTYWRDCGRCHHAAGECPSITRVIGTGQTFRFPAAPGRQH